MHTTSLSPECRTRWCRQGTDKHSLGIRWQFFLAGNTAVRQPHPSAAQVVPPGITCTLTRHQAIARLLYWQVTRKPLTRVPLQVVPPQLVGAGKRDKAVGALGLLAQKVLLPAHKKCAQKGRLTVIDSALGHCYQPSLHPSYHPPCDPPPAAHLSPHRMWAIRSGARLK